VPAQDVRSESVQILKITPNTMSLMDCIKGKGGSHSYVPLEAQ
jgi:hypothetical protein